VLVADEFGINAGRLRHWSNAAKRAGTAAEVVILRDMRKIPFCGDRLMNRLTHNIYDTPDVGKGKM